MTKSADTSRNVQNWRSKPSCFVLASSCKQRLDDSQSNVAYASCILSSFTAELPPSMGDLAGPLCSAGWNRGTGDAHTQTCWLINTQTEDWDLGRVYRDLAGIRCLDIPKFASKNQVTIPTELMQLMQLNEDYRKFLKEVTNRARNPSLPKGTMGKDRQKQFNARRKAQKPDILLSTPLSSTSGYTASTPVPFRDNTQATARLRLDCPTCKNYVRPEDKCVRIWEVDKQDVRGLRGCVITCADPDDRLEPKVDQYCEFTPSYSLQISCAGMERSRSQEENRHNMEDTRGAWPQRASSTRRTAHSRGLQARHNSSCRPKVSDTGSVSMH
jgi:hypothetical protein